MSLFNNVANIFRTQPASPVIVPSNVPTPPLAAVNPGADPAVVPPAGGSKNDPAPNPLDDFAKLMQNDPKVTPPADPLSTPLFNTDPTKLQAAAKNIDFMKNVSPELLAKVNAGNDPAALMTLLNQVAQQTLVTATQLSTAAVEQATQRNNQRLVDDVLPARVKDIQLSQMQAENPVLQHPAAQPFLSMIKQQIKMKDASLSPAQINAKAEQALLGFASQIAPTAPSTDPRQRATSGTDWDTWAGV